MKMEAESSFRNVVFLLFYNLDHEQIIQKNNFTYYGHHRDHKSLSLDPVLSLIQSTPHNLLF
jgi:hypothetical protein